MQQPMKNTSSSAAGYPWLEKISELFHESDDENPEDFNLLSAPTSRISHPLKKCSTVFVIDCSRSSTRGLPEKLFELQKCSSDTATLDQADVSRNLTSQSWMPSLHPQKETCLWREIFLGVSNYMKSRIIANQFDKLGVVLYDVATDHQLFGSPRENSNPPTATSRIPQFPGVKTLIELDVVSLDGVTSMEETANMSLFDFKREHLSFQTRKLEGDSSGRADSARRSYLFWYLHQLFNATSPEKRYRRNIYFVTGNEDPAISVSEKRRTAERVVGALQSNILVEVIALETPGFPFFDFTKFYADLFETEGGIKATPEEFAQSALRLEQLVAFLRKKDNNPRIISRLPFKLWEGISFSVNVYLRIYERKPPSAFYVDSETHAPLRSVTRSVCATTGKKLKPEDVKKYYVFGGEKVYVTPEEREALTRYSWTEEARGYFRLLGFKSISCLKLHDVMKRSYFLYPNETPDGSGVYGSSKIVAALLANMEKKHVCAVVSYMLRPGTPPRLGALLPQFEEVTPHPEEEQLTPPGFHLIPLPFADDIRETISTVSQPLRQEGPSGLGTESKTDCNRMSLVNQLIREWRLEHFDPRRIPNPALQFHYSRLEALSLNAMEAQNVEDATKAAKASPAITNLLDQWKEALATVAPLEAALKPAAVKDQTARPATALSTKAIRTLSGKKELDSLLLPQLKAYLAKKRLPVSGKKSDLKQRIDEYLNRTAPEMDSTDEEEVETRISAKRQKTADTTIDALLE